MVTLIILCSFVTFQMNTLSIFLSDDVFSRKTFWEAIERHKITMCIQIGKVYKCLLFISAFDYYISLNHSIRGLCVLTPDT